MRKDWVEVEFADLVDNVTTSNQKIKQKEYLLEGEYPIVDQGQELIGGYTNDKSKVLICSLPVIVFGDHTKIVKLINFPFVPGADGTKILQPKQNINAKLLEYFTKIIVQKIENKGYARHYQFVEKEYLSLPPLPEQRAIVSKIELLFSELDNAVSNLKQAKDRIEIYRQSVLKKAFEGNWKLVELNKVCDKIQDGSHFSPQNQILNKKDGYFPYITSKNIRNNFMDLKNVAYVDSDFHESIYKRCNPEYEDVLLTKDGVNTGNVCINTLSEPFSLLSSVCLLKPDKKLLNSHFLSYYIQSPIGFKKIVGKMTGTAIKRIILKKIKEATIPLPSLKEQIQIVQEIETRFSVADKMAEAIDESLVKAEALRQSILKKAFEGELLSDTELAACRKEKDWERAEMLLERIKKEKKD